MSFLNEVRKTSGDLRVNGSLAYVEQEADIFPGTVRSNILFGKNYDNQKYERIVGACCLLDDFKDLPNSDMTEIGEKGIKLSGGQKARISLARAVYSDADIYLLDDPLSAVDTKVAKLIFWNVIKGLLKDKTVLLATHQVDFAKKADKIILLENRSVKVEGDFEEILKKDASMITTFETSLKGNLQSKENDIKLSSKIGQENDSIQVEKPKEIVNSEKGKLFSQELDDSKQVEIKTYLYYFRNLGSAKNWAFLIISAVAIEVLNLMYMKFLSYWTQGVWKPSFSIKTLGGIVGGFTLSLILREILFTNTCLKASNVLHRTALERVIRALVSFFDTNQVGRILNRFSNDMGVMDKSLVQASNDLLDAFFFVGSVFIAVWVIAPWLLIPGVGLILCLYILTRITKKKILEGRSIELLTRSPIESLLSMTATGLISIRVYQQQSRFIRNFMHLLNKNCCAYNAYYDASRVLGFYSDLLSGFFTRVSISVLLALNNYDPPILGLATTLLLAFIDYIQWTMRQILTHTMLMSSTARIKSYTELEQEDALVQPNDITLLGHASWPSQGEIEFKNVFMRYRNTTDHVLKGLTFSVKHGEKIGCVGRTGAGKISIIQALFRTVKLDKQGEPPQSSDSTGVFIDGVDTSTIGLHTLRKNISIIPQTPFVFNGTIKRNLDPLNAYSDEEIIKALQETDLWENVKSLPNGIDTDMTNAASVFSVGQKQLMCLNRVILQKSRILVLDEATANVDFETDNFIQQKILEKFKDSTVFAIAHRISTVAKYDKVLVVDKGKVVEFDHPYLLLVRNVGDSWITNIDGVFATMVLHTGDTHSRLIFENAKSSYFQKNVQQ